MGRKVRRVIAINEATHERREYESVYACSRDLGVSIQAVQLAQGLCGTSKGWRIYDEPSRIRERIEELKRQIETLES